MSKTSTSTSRPLYDVLAVDGEGVTLPNGQHLYTLLLAYDSRFEKSRYIENWESGLDTDRILHFLLHLPRGKRTLVCTYFMNYDVTMWIRDFSDEQKAALWHSGWTVYRGPRSSQYYYVRYMPGKIFFIGQYDQSIGQSPSMFDWRGTGLLSTTIYDTSGFAQRAFVRALEEWDIPSGSIGEMKAERSTFTRMQHREITNYCEDECVALAAWVQKQDETFLSEGIDLQSWHGGGALAGYFLRANRVDQYVKDPEHSEELTHAIRACYFGGRSECFHMGHIRGPVYDYDLNSAYPAMACYVPHLTTDGSGVWSRTSKYISPTVAPYALWHCSWDNQVQCALPFRYRHGVYYPSSGAGWYHAYEVSAARKYGMALQIDTGWVYTPPDDLRPFDFVREYARRRMAYKALADPRAIPYKYGLNSLYGKLAQHAIEEGRTPRYQSYYAAGLITSMTRAMLLHFIHADGHDMSDVLMLATDGVFCLEPRTRYLGDRLGQFSLAGTLPEMVLLQPGCWYAPDGQSRTRGYHKESVTYNHALANWLAMGVRGSLSFQETRFIGLGSCVGRGDFSQYGRWVTEERKLLFMPDHKLPGADLLNWRSSGTLVPMSMAGMESEAYTPPRVQDPEPAVENLAWLLEQWEELDQPDFSD